MHAPTETARPHTVLFDLDGTIADSKPGIAAGIRRGLAAVGIDVADDHDWDPYIGPPLAPALRERHDLSEEDVDRAVAAYLDYYGTVGKTEASVYAGMAELIADLVAGGRRVGVATTKRCWLAEEILEHFGLVADLDVIVGAERDGSGGDKPTLIRGALAELGVAGDELGGVVMVGDRHHDVAGARAVGVVAVGVLWGYGDAAELDEAGAQHLVADVAELRALLGLAPVRRP